VIRLSEFSLFVFETFVFGLSLFETTIFVFVYATFLVLFETTAGSVSSG
jgi:hypothetical protein